MKQLMKGSSIVKVIMLLVITSFCTACNNTRIDKNVSGSLEYLDLQNLDIRTMTPEESAIIDEVERRLGLYVEDRIFKFRHEDAKEINVSERLCNYVKSLYQYSNFIFTQDSMWLHLTRQAQWCDYLDIQNYDVRNQTQEEKAIICKAEERMGLYEYSEGVFKFIRPKFAAELNMSEKLFDWVKSQY